MYRNTDGQDTPRSSNNEKDKVESMVDNGTLSRKTKDVLLEWANALDKETTRHKYLDDNDQVKTFEPRSIGGYLQCLRLCEQRGLDLLECTADGFNDFIDTLHDDRGHAQDSTNDAVRN